MPVTQAPQAPGDGNTAKRDAVFSDVLCAVDGTERSYTAVEQAATLAGPAGQLTLLAVTAVAGSGKYKSAAISSERAERVLARAKRIAEKAGVRSTEVMDPGGPPSAVILRTADQRDLLALGAPAMSVLGGMFVGGVAFETLDSFAIPMLMARAAPKGLRFARRILVASDALDGSDQVVELTGRLAREQEASVILLHAAGVDSKGRPSRIKAQAHALESVLPASSEAIVERGRARDTIVEIAGSAGVSLVVMGSRRRGALHALGSVSRRVVHDAPCSVLLVPPEDLPG
jgi:nucleotide-binding universal stress UspA family protein